MKNFKAYCLFCRLEGIPSDRLSSLRKYYDFKEECNAENN